jgi:hypothetical protein
MSAAAMEPEGQHKETADGDIDVAFDQNFCLVVTAFRSGCRTCENQPVSDSTTLETNGDALLIILKRRDIRTKGPMSIIYCTLVLLLN